MSDPADNAIEVRGLSKRFEMRRGRRDSVKERLVRGRSPRAEEFWALKDATFNVPRGSMFGIIGHNGSGKSTALKVITGIYRPTSGTVKVGGRVSALLELGAGFHPELTGRENITLNASILGLSPKRIAEVTDEIIEFADIGSFIDSPIKVYSSGMHVRLGFAIAIHVDPEILIIDEVIAVGDEVFQRRCYDHLYELRRKGTTILIVTHALGVVRDWCDQGIWLDHGRIRGIGSGIEIVDEYLESVNKAEAAAAQPSRSARTLKVTPQGEAEPEPEPESEATSDSEAPGARGTGEVRIKAIELLSGDGAPVAVFVAGAPGVIRMHYTATHDLPSVTFGLGFFTVMDINVAGPNSGRSGPVSVTQGSGFIDFRMPEVLLAPATYRVDVAAVEADHIFDYAEAFARIAVRGDGVQEPGLLRIPGEWVSGG